jgi:hypothetical protein
MKAFMMSRSSFLITFLPTFKTMHAKISLSPEETALVLDPRWILTKRSVMDKVAALLGDMAERYRTLALHAPFGDRFPKLTRGENYEGLPYMILDYPASWEQEHAFAVRTFFWWGHYFALFLHLKGRYREQYAPKILLSLGSPWRLAISDDEWIHTVHGEGYVGSPFNAEMPAYFKVAMTIPLNQWDNVYDLLEAGFREIMTWVSYPVGERGL